MLIKIDFKISLTSRVDLDSTDQQIRFPISQLHSLVSLERNRYITAQLTIVGLRVLIAATAFSDLSGKSPLIHCSCGSESQ